MIGSWWLDCLVFSEPSPMNRHRLKPNTNMSPCDHYPQVRSNEGKADPQIRVRLLLFLRGLTHGRECLPLP